MIYNTALNLNSRRGIKRSSKPRAQRSANYVRACKRHTHAWRSLTLCMRSTSRIHLERGSRRRRPGVGDTLPRSRWPRTGRVTIAQLGS